MSSTKAFAIPTLGDVILTTEEARASASKKMLNGTGRGSVIAATPHVPAPVQVVYDTAPDVIP